MILTKEQTSALADLLLPIINNKRKQVFKEYYDNVLKDPELSRAYSKYKKAGEGYNRLCTQAESLKRTAIKDINNILNIHIHNFGNTKEDIAYNITNNNRKDSVSKKELCNMIYLQTIDTDNLETLTNNILKQY